MNLLFVYHHLTLRPGSFSVAHTLAHTHTHTHTDYLSRIRTNTHSRTRTFVHNAHVLSLTKLQAFM